MVDLKFLMENPDLAANMRFEISGSDMITVIQSSIDIALKQAKPAELNIIEQPISQPEAIQFLGKSRQTLIQWRKKGIIRAHTLGGRVYYMRSELLEALKSKN